MKVIQYRALYAEGEAQFVTVTARNIDSGAVKALKIALRGVPAAWGNFHSLEFWAVLS